MQDDAPRPPRPAGGQVLSLAAKLEQKQMARLRAQSAKMHVRELEAAVSWLDMTKQLESLSFDADLARLAGDEAPAARRRRGELRSLRALQRCLRGEVEAGYAEWDEVVAEVPDLALPHLLRGRWRMNAEPREALAHFDRAAEIEPRDASVYWRRGDCYEKIEDHERALANYRRALALDPGSIDGLHAMGKALVAIGRPDEALRYYDEAITRAPRYVDFYQSRAVAHEVLDHHLAAVRDYDRMVELNPDHHVARYARARCLAEAGEVDRAVEELRALATVLPEAAEIPLLLGKLFVTTQQSDAAFEALSRAIELAPDQAEAWGQRALSLLQKGEKARALADAERAVELAPNASEYTFLRIVLGYEGDHAGKLAALNEAVERFPRSATLLGERAEAHAKLGNHEDALADWDALLASFPDDDDYLLGRVRALGMLQRYQEAQDEASRLIERDPDNGTAYALRANHRDHLGVDDAIVAADWTRAGELAPDDIAIRYYRGRYLEQKGEYEAAAADFDHLLTLSPDFAEAYYWRAYCQYRIEDEPPGDEDWEDWEEDAEAIAARCRAAIADLERALELGYRDPDVYVELHWNHRAQNDVAAACAVLDRGIEAHPTTDFLYRLRHLARLELKDESGAEADRLRAEALKTTEA